MTKTGYLVIGVILVAMLTTAIFAGAAWGQDVVKLAPQINHVVFENAQYRVIDYHLRPGETEPMHTHPNGLLVYWFSTATLRITLADGNTSESQNKAGEVVWRDPVTHRIQNTGTTEAHALLIEPTTPCSVPLENIPAPAQDPTKLAPQMYKVVFENDRYRVIDYHLASGRKEPMHSHPNGVLVYWFSDAKMRTTLDNGTTADSTSKGGDVVWRDPVTHHGENIGSTEAHSLLIEPKVGFK